MNILWLCNGVISNISKEYGIENGGISWIDSIFKTISKRENICLSVVFPISDKKKIVKKEKDNVEYYGFPKKVENPAVYEKELETVFETLLKEIQPDIIHIFGTEFPHTLSMVRACNRLGLDNRVIINIQGLCSYIAKHYYASLPINIIKKYTFRDFLKHDNIQCQKRIFEIRGEYEKEAIQQVHHVIGRTEWDKACVSQLNRNINYYKCNENMRENFYINKWNLKKCERNSIFISQAYYPLKGFHHVLEAVAIIKKYYKDIQVYTTGKDVFCLSKLERLKESSYSKYIRFLICKYELRDNVKFLGYLSEQEMCERYLKSHVFVSASSIENSSNSVAEAMLLGMPVVASAVGGIPDMLTDKKEGFLYQSDAPYMLAHYIMKFFDDDQISESYGQAARKRALYDHDQELNNQKLIEIYEKVAKI